MIVTIYISIIKNYLRIKKIFKNSLFRSVKISSVSYIFSYTVIEFCPTVAESLLASGQPIECFHSRGQHPCKFIGTKESVCIRKEPGGWTPI